MNTIKGFFQVSLFFFACGFTPLLANQSTSIKLEIERAIGKGVKWLNHEQNRSSGHWGEADYPALTALALRATMGHPDELVVAQYSSNQIKGF